MDNNDKRLEKINRFSRRELSEDEVYCFSVILCDNEIDRDKEKFTVPALKKLAELYIGKTGIFSHDPRGENQTARIYDTEVITDSSRKTFDGEAYTFLKAYAYMVRTSSNADLIKEIDGGIKKEVSVGCSVSKEICSICHRDCRIGECAHKKGKAYNGRLCYRILDEPTDAYEWSFVAVPAQKGAGVTKRFSGSEEKSSPKDNILERLTEELRRDILKLSFLEGDSVCASIAKSAIEKMAPEELLNIKKELSKKLVLRPSELEKAIEKTSAEHAEQTNTSFRV